MVLRRPQAGVVFDRFYDAWLGAGPADQLKAFLEKRSAAPDAKAADHLVLALFFTRQGAEAEALKAYEKALQMDAGNASAWGAKARLQAGMQDLDGAVKSLEKGLAAKPEANLKLEMAKQRARHLLRLGRQEDALKAYQDLLTANPDDEDLAEEIVYTQMEEGLNEEAEKGAEALIAKTKDAYVKVTRLILLGDIQLKRGSRDDSSRTYEKALQLTGQGTWVEGEVLARIEQGYRREDDLEGLAAKLKDLVQDQPARVKLAERLARTLADLGKTDEAVKIYQDLLARTPGQQSVREGFLNLLEAANRLPEAIEQAKTLRDQNAGDKEWLIRLAALQHRAKDEAAAQASLDAYLAAAGTGEAERLRVARTLETWELKDAARQAYENLVKAHGDSLSARESQAQFLHRIEEREAALAIWRDIAMKGSLEDALHVAQTLGARLESETALELLMARLDKAANDPRLLTALCTAAAGAKEFDKAMPWAMERVRLARGITDVEQSVKDASMIIRNAGKEEATAKALAALPSPLPSERCLLAELREALKDPAGAEAALAELKGPDEALGLQQLVRLLQIRQEWGRAAATMEKLAGLPGSNTSANIQTLVDLHQRAGQPEEALKWIPEWKKVSPGAVTPWTVEARILSDTNRPDDSIRVLREALRKFPDNPELAATTGDQLVMVGQAVEAMQIFESWYEKTDDITAKMRWASSLARAAMTDGSTAALVDRFQERQKKNRQSIVPWIALAEIHRAAGNADARREALRQASNLRPQDLTLLMELARLQEDDGLWKEALATLETARPLDKTTMVRERQAAIHLRYGDENLGYRILFELAGGDQTDARSVERMADGIAARGEWERLVQFLEPLLEKFPKDYRLKYLMAVALEEAGKEQEAIRAFLALMQPGDELPGVVIPPGGVNGMRANYYQDEVLRTLPEGVVDFFELTQTWQNAYRYRQSRNNGTYYSYAMPGMQAPTGFVPTPPYAVTAPSYAAIHLIGIAQNMNAANKADLVTRLKRMDMPQAEMYVNLSWDPQQGGVVVDDDWLEAHPGEKVALAWWVLHRSFQNPGAGAPSIKLLRSAFDTFRESHPGLAVQAALTARFGEDAESKQLFAEGLTIIKGMQKLDLLVTQNALTLLQREAGGPTLRPEDEDTLIKGIQSQLNDDDPRTIPYKTWMVNTFARIFVQRERWPDAVALAQRDQEIYEKNAAGNAAQARQQRMMYSMMGMGNQRVAAPLPFPFEATGLSPGAVGVFLPNLAQTYIYEQEEEEQVKVTNRNEPLLKAAAEIKHEGLRHLALLAGGEEKAFTTYLEAKLKAEPASPGAILLSAWYAQQSKDAPKAVDLLRQSLTLALDAEQRTQVEYALLHLATAASGDGSATKLPAEALDAVKEIARRYARNTSLSSGQKQQLAQTLQTLGLNKEAATLRTASTTNMPGRISGFSPSTGAPGSPSTVEQLINKNQRDAAAREASKQLKVLVPEVFGSNSSYAASRAYELMEIVKKRDLAPDILKASDPGEGAGPRRILEYAAMHELLGKNAEALVLYNQVLEKSPRTPEAMTRMILLTAAQDPKTASAKLAELKQPGTMAMLVQNLVNVMQSGNRETKFTERLNTTRTLTLYLEAVAASGKPLPPDLPAAYVAMGPRAIGQAHYGQQNDFEAGEPRLPNLFENSLYDGTHDSRQDLAGLKSPQGIQRREVLEELCRAMMKIPELADQGFAPLAGLSLVEKKDVAAVRAMAVACLDLTYKPENRRRLEALQRQGGYSYSSGGDTQVWQPKPTEFLIYQAWLDKAPDRVETEVVSHLAAPDGKETEAQTSARHFARLWFGKPEEFTDAADAWGKPQMRGYGDSSWIWFSDGGLMENVLRIARERKLEISLDDWLIKKVVAVTKQNNHVDMDKLHPWVRTIAEQGGSARVIAFIEKLGTDIFSDDEGRKKAVKEYLGSRYGGSSTNNARSYSYGRFVESLLQEEVAPAAAMTIMLRDRWLDEPNAANQLSGYVDNDAMFKDLPALTALLTSSPLGADAAGFRAYMTRGSGSMTMLGTLLNGLRGRQSERKEVLKALKEVPNPPFGVKLSMAALEEKHDVAIMEFVTANVADISRQKPEVQDEVRSVLKVVWPALRRPESMPPDRQNILRPLFATEMKTSEERRKMLMTATGLEQMKMEDRVFMDFLRGEILNLVGSKKEDEAAALFDKACQLIEKKMGVKGWDDGQNWNGWTPRSELADEILDYRNGWDLLRFGARLYNTDTSGQLEHPGHPETNRWSDTLLVDGWKLEGGGLRPVKAFEQVMRWTWGVMKETPSAILSPALSGFAGKMEPGQRKRLIEWAETEGPKRPFATIARQFAVAARFYNFHTPGKQVERDEHGQRKPDPDSPSMRAEDWEYLRAQLLDESLNPRVRLAIANWVCHYGREEIDSQFVRSAVKLSAEALRKSWAFSAFHLGAVVRCFNQETVDEDWKKLAQELWDAWLVRNSKNRESSRFGRAYQPTSTAIFAVWEMAVRARQKSWQTRLRADFSNTLNDSYLTFAALARQGDMEGATEFLRSQWKDLTQWVPFHDSLDGVGPSNSEIEGQYSAHHAAARDKFVAACPDPALAELGRVFMDVGNDPPPGYFERFSTMPDYRARRQAAGESFNAAAFTDEAMQARAVGWLFSSVTARDRTRELVHTLASKQKLASTPLAASTQNMRWQVLIPLMDAHNQALDGDIKPFEELYGAIRNNATSSEYIRDYALTYVGRMALSRTRLFWRSQPPAKAKDGLGAATVILKNFSTNDEQQLGDALGVFVAAHLYDGDAEGLKKWRESLKPDQVSQFIARLRTQGSLFVTLGDLFGRDASRLPLEKRLALIEAAVKDEWVQEAAKKNPGASFKMSHLMGKAALLSRQEMLAHGMKIAALIPREGRSFTEMADLFEEEGMEKETLEALSAIIAVAANNPGQQYPALIRKAETLDSLDRRAEAAALLEGMDPSKLSNSQKWHVDRVKRRAADAAKKAGSPEANQNEPEDAKKNPPPAS